MTLLGVSVLASTSITEIATALRHEFDPLSRTFSQKPRGRSSDYTNLATQ